MTSAHTILALLLGTILSLTGCAPLPSTTPVLPPISGTVVDAKTKEPISGAMVTVERAGYEQRTKTSSSGLFALKPVSQWHYLVYIGSPGVVPVPWCLRQGPVSATISASSDGYQTSSLTIPSLEKHFVRLQLPPKLQIELRR
jgi:hypothetical protein